jgi:phospholipid transport system substrate-binding protein
VTVESYLEGGASPVRLDWRLARSGDGWRVLDVMVEGVSLLLTYRNEFAAVIEKGGGHVSALLGELRTRVAEQRAQIAS